MQRTDTPRGEVEVEREVEAEAEARPVVQARNAEKDPLPENRRPDDPPPTNTAAATPTISESRILSFTLIDQKLGYRRGSETDADRMTLLAECLLEEPSRDAWLELPPDTVRQTINEATQHYRKNGDFKGQFIKLLDQQTRENRKASQTSNHKSAWENILKRYEAERGEVSQE